MPRKYKIGDHAIIKSESELFPNEYRSWVHVAGNGIVSRHKSEIRFSRDALNNYFEKEVVIKKLTHNGNSNFYTAQFLDGTELRYGISDAMLKEAGTMSGIHILF